jgi:hypothetical protein
MCRFVAAPERTHLVIALFRRDTVPALAGPDGHTINRCRELPVIDPGPGQARSFGTAADDYDRHRPSYAPDAVTWALGEHPVRVADAGAGTGILSRLLHGLGNDVVAVEPPRSSTASTSRPVATGRVRL